MSVESTTKTTPEIGDKMPDGTIYAGISPDTHKPMYATPADAPLRMHFNQAQDYADNIDFLGHQDWRVPTRGELNVLFDNRAAIGGFRLIGSDPAGLYWSSSQDNGSRWQPYDYEDWNKSIQRFSDGYQASFIFPDRHRLSLRCVR